MGIVPQVVHDFVLREQVDPGGHGGMGGEDLAGLRHLTGFVKAEAILLHHHPNPLQSQEGRVPFVHVVGGGLQTQCPQHPHPANAEENFLVQAHVNVATVQFIGDVVVVGGVGFDVGVE